VKIAKTPKTPQTSKTSKSTNPKAKNHKLAIAGLFLVDEPSKPGGLVNEPSKPGGFGQ